MIETLDYHDPSWHKHNQALQEATSLGALVLSAWQIGLWLARQILQQELRRRAEISTLWGDCHHCGKRLCSKGWKPRQMLTLVGRIQWKRRVGRCPNKCPESGRIPLDEALEIQPYQQTSVELVRLGCLLAVFVPFEVSAWMLGQFTGVLLSADTVWNWVQSVGRQAQSQWESEIQALAQGRVPEPEALTAMVANMTLAIATDGVMVPLRPYNKTPKGKTLWREVKVAVLARLGKYLNKSGKEVTRLRHRRLVAVLGNIEQLRSRLQIQAFRSGVEQAPLVIWLSDGAKGFWQLYQQCFSQVALGILDFYHAAQNLWKAAAAALDGRTIKARKWFNFVRHQLRHGESEQVIAQLAHAIEFPLFSKSVLNTLTNVHDYLQTHREHINYKRFKELGLPLGSGMVESACKWLIQQRFKGVGMRWSEDGFNHLLHLRLAWVNDRFDDLFSVSVNPSPNR
jgi:hypothetical protein